VLSSQLAKLIVPNRKMPSYSRVAVDSEVMRYSLIDTEERDLRH
jgi:hypothetical protein